MNRFVDTHTHLFEPEFLEDRDDVVKRAVSCGVVKMCLPCITESSILPVLDMCVNYSGICFPMIGLHPTEVGDDYKEQLRVMKQYLDDDKRFIAVGEVGLDLYWDDSRRSEQIDAFETQIGWAREKNMPLSIHSRNAFNDLLATLQRCGCYDMRGVFHCFSGTEEELEKLLPFEGFMFGIGGVVTYKKSLLPAVVSRLPMERILLETDSPYLAPVPYRGKRNESSYIPFIAQRIADVRGMTLEEVANVTTCNAERLFGI